MRTRQPWISGDSRRRRKGHSTDRPNAPPLKPHVDLPGDQHRIHTNPPTEAAEGRKSALWAKPFQPEHFLPGPTAGRREA